MNETTTSTYDRISELSHARSKEGLISVKMDSFQARLWSPERLKRLEQERPGELFRRQDVVRERYVLEVLQTTRNVADADGNLEIQRDYSAEIILVDQGGYIVRLPWSVIERAQSYKNALQRQALSEEAKERAQATIAAQEAA